MFLSTNVLDSQALSPDQMLAEYKAQQVTERGFRFLKAHIPQVVEEEH